MRDQIRSFRIALGFLVLVGLTRPAPAVTPLYYLEDLGPGAGRAINNRGQVVIFEQANGALIRYTDGIGREVLEPNPRFYPVDVNDLGQIVGRNDVLLEPGSRPRPFFYSDDTGVRRLDTGAMAIAINNAGEFIIEQQPRIYSLEQNQLVFRTIPSEAGIPADLNDTGIVAGNYQGQATLYVPGSGVHPIPLPNSLGAAINERGQVAGTFTRELTPYLFRTTPDGVPEELGRIGPRASVTGMNDLGQIVGTDYEIIGNGSEPDRRFGFVYTDGLGVRDLNDLIDPSLGWHLSSASDINNAGQIVGLGYVQNQTRAFRLTPIPEPGSLILLGSGFVGLLPAMRRKRPAPDTQFACVKHRVGGPKASSPLSPV